MTRDDMIFDVNYSFHLEKMYFTVLTRIDKAITMLLIVLGFSVFAPFMNLFLFGVTVAFLSVIQLVYQFGQAAGLSKEQMRQYRRLLVELSSLTDEELREKYIKIQDEKLSEYVKKISQTASDASDAAEKALKTANATVASMTVEYYKSTSSTELKGGTWQSGAVTATQGYYIWSRTKTVAQDDTVTYSQAACITGATGAKGDTGATGEKGDT